MLTALVYLLVILAAGYAAFWFTDQGIPAPMNVIVKILIAAIGLYAIFTYVLPIAALH